MKKNDSEAREVRKLIAALKKSLRKWREGKGTESRSNPPLGLCAWVDRVDSHPYARLLRIRAFQIITPTDKDLELVPNKDFWASGSISGKPRKLTLLRENLAILYILILEDEIKKEYAQRFSRIGYYDFQMSLKHP